MVKRNTKLYLKIAHFTILLSFGYSDIIWRYEFIDSIEKYWGKAGFLTKNPGKVNFTIEFRDEPTGIPILLKDKKNVYSLDFIKNFRNKKFIAHYNISLPSFQIMLKEILNFLLEEQGMILHASSVIDSKGRLFAFLAPRGGGKSTTANKIAKNKDFDKFSDDNLILIRKAKFWEAYSVPIVEKDGLKEYRRAKKVKLFRIIKSDRKSVKKIDSGAKKLKIVLKQIWYSKEEVGEKDVKLTSGLVNENDIYDLFLPRQAKGIERLIYET